MNIISETLTIIFLGTCCLHTVAQTSKTSYIGQHYGDHTPWQYFYEVNKKQNGDTLEYTQIRFNRDQIKAIEEPSLKHKIRMVLRGDKQPIILYDSARYSWLPYPIYVSVSEDYVEYADRGKPLQQLALDTAKLPVFGTLESLELYLANSPIDENFEQSFYFIGENDFRKFKVKNTGTFPNVLRSGESVKAHHLSVISLDSSNVMDSRLVIAAETGQLISKEYIVLEKTSGVQRKSIGFEHSIREDYVIDLQAIENPTAANHIEAAFTLINSEKEVDQSEVLRLLDKALEMDFNVWYVMSKLNAQNFYGLKDEIKKEVTSCIEKKAFDLRDMLTLANALMKQENYQVAREVYIYCSDRWDEEAAAHYYLGTYYQSQKDNKSAKKAFETSIKKAEATNNDRIKSAAQMALEGING